MTIRKDVMVCVYLSFQATNSRDTKKVLNTMRKKLEQLDIHVGTVEVAGVADVCDSCNHIVKGENLTCENCGSLLTDE